MAKPIKQQLTDKLREDLGTYGKVNDELLKEKADLKKVPAKHKPAAKESIKQKTRALKALKRTVTRITKEIDAIDRAARRNEK